MASLVLCLLKSIFIITNITCHFHQTILENAWISFFPAHMTCIETQRYGWLKPNGVYNLIFEVYPSMLCFNKSMQSLCHAWCYVKVWINMLYSMQAWCSKPKAVWKEWTVNKHEETSFYVMLTHWGRMTHICVSKLNIIGSDNGLSPGRRQAIIWTSAGILLMGPLGTNFSEILSEINTFSFEKMHLKMSSGKCLPFCLCFNVLTHSAL